MTTQNRTWIALSAAIFLAHTTAGFAQQIGQGGYEQQQQGWRKVGESGPPQGVEQDRPFDSRQQQQRQQPQQQNGQPAYPRSIVSPQLILPAGSWVTVSVNEPISTDHNQPGDAFTATLAQPLVADGLVIAQRGQTVAGRVVESQKSGRVKGTSRLVIELTELSLVDGQQVPIQTQLAERNGGTSVGRDVGAIAATTGAGAAIGAAVDGGMGAGIGAIAGAAVSTIGVLVTRGNNTTVYPETLLTFRIVAPVVVNTMRSEQAFQPPMQDAYEQQQNFSYRPQPQQRVAVAPYYSPYNFYSPYGGYYGPYYGSGLSFSYGGGYYGRGYGYRGGGYRGGGYRGGGYRGGGFRHR